MGLFEKKEQEQEQEQEQVNEQVNEQLESKIEEVNSNKQLNEDISNSNSIKNIIEGKNKSFAILGIIIAIFLFIFISEEEVDSIKKISSLDTIKVKVDNNKDLLSSYKDKNVLAMINSLDQRLRKSEKLNNSKNFFNNANTKEIIFKSYKEIENYLFSGEYEIEEREFFKRNGQSIQHEILGNVTDIQNKVVIPIENGGIVKYEDIGVEYIINSSEATLEDFSKISVWKLSTVAGFSKIYSLSEKEEVLSVLNQKTFSAEEVFIQKVKNTLFIINKSGNIEEEYKFKKRIKKNKMKSGSYKLNKVIRKYKIKAFLNDLLENYKEEDGLLYKSNKLISDKDDISNYYYIEDRKSEFENKRIGIWRYINGYPYNFINIDRVKRISLYKYQEKKKGVEYISRKGKILKYDLKTGEMEVIAPKGKIIGNVSESGLKDIKIEVETEDEIFSNLIEFLNYELIGKDLKVKVEEVGVTIIKDNEVLYEEAPIHLFKISSSGQISANRIALGKITKVKKIGEVGAEIETVSYLVQLISKSEIKIFTKSNHELFKNSNETLNKLSFKINNNSTKLAVYEEIKTRINLEEKTINGINYDTFEEKEGSYILYNKYGEILKKIIKQQKHQLFNEEIINFKVIDGKLFKYYYDKEENKAKIIDKKLGFLEKKFGNSVPFKSFIRKTTKRNFLSQKIEKEEEKEILLLDIFRKININKYIFINEENKSFSLPNHNVLYFEGTKQKLKYKQAFFNKENKIFTFIFDNAYLKGREIRKIVKQNNIILENDKLVFLIGSVELKNKNIFHKNKYLFNYKEGRSKRERTIFYNGSKFEVVILKNANLLESKLYFKTKKSNYSLNVEKISKMNSNNVLEMANMYKVYLKEQNRKEKESVKKKLGLIPSEKILTEKELEKKYQDFVKKQSKPIKITKMKVPERMAEKLEKEAKKEAEDIFTIEIGSKMKIKNSKPIEVSEGSDTIVLATVFGVDLEDYNGRRLQIPKAIGVFKAKGTFDSSIKKITLHLEQIIYKDYNSNKKRKIEVGDSATRFIYKDVDSGYESIGVPAFFISGKYKTINQRIMLGALADAVELLVPKEPTDMMSQMMGGASMPDPSASTLGSSDTNENNPETEASSTVVEEIGDFLESWKEDLEKEKDLLIIENGIEGFVEFIEEVNIIEEGE